MIETPDVADLPDETLSIEAGCMPGFEFARIRLAKWTRDDVLTVATTVAGLEESVSEGYAREYLMNVIGRVQDLWNKGRSEPAPHTEWNVTGSIALTAFRMENTVDAEADDAACFSLFKRLGFAHDAGFEGVQRSLRQPAERAHPSGCSLCGAADHALIVVPWATYCRNCLEHMLRAVSEVEAEADAQARAREARGPVVVGFPGALQIQSPDGV